VGRSDELEPYTEEVMTALKDLRNAIVDALNNGSELEALGASIRKWEEVRQKINNGTNMGVLLSVKWSIVFFPITGDIHRDVGQINFKKLEEQ